MQLAGIVNQLTTLGDPEPDGKVVLKYLQIARPRYKQLVLSIETLLDVSTLSLEEVTGQLKTVEDDVVEPSIAEGRLLLIEEEWHKKSKKKETRDGSWGGSNGNRSGHGHGPNRGGGHGGRGDGNGSPGWRGNCHRSGKPGHWASECRSKQPMKEYTTQEEEQSLLLVEIDSVQGSVGGKFGGALILDGAAVVGGSCGRQTKAEGAQVLDPVGVGIPDAAPAGMAAAGGEQEIINGKSGGGQELMHLVEQKVCAALNEEGDKDPRWWVLNTGASNHMMGS
jgi:hypothetical protein